MRPQKPKDRNRKWKGYFLDDIACKYCIRYRGKRGCVKPLCDYECEKPDAIKHGRIKRKRDDVI